MPHSPIALRILVANLSANVVEIKNHVVTLRDEHQMNQRTIVRSGDLVKLLFPVGQLAGRSGEVPAGIKLRYLSAGIEGETDYREFRIEIHNGHVVDINEGTIAPISRTPAITS